MVFRKSVVAASVTMTMILVGVAAGARVSADPAVPGPDDLVVGPNAILTLEAGQESNTDASTQGSDLDNQGAAALHGPGGEQFSFGLKARNSDRSLLMGLMGGAITLCSIHGPPAQVDFVTENGNNPLPDMQCGRAFGMDVGLKGCAASLEFHGFVHSDRSTRIYFGPMTADVKFQKTGANTGNMHLTIFTPKAPIVLNGQVQSPEPIVMTTCVV